MNFQNNIPKYLFGYGLCVFPLFLLIGPLISEIFLISIIFFSFYYIFKLNKSYFYSNRYTIFFIIFYLSVLISTLLNFYNFDYAISGIMYFRLPLFALASWFVFENYKLFSKKIVIFYIFFFSIIIIDSLIQYITGENIIGYNILKSRVSSFFGEELILGGFLTRVLPIFLLFLVLGGMFHEKKNNIYFALILSLVVVIIYLSGERSSFFLLILFFSTLFFTTKYLRKFIIIITLFSVCFSFAISKIPSSDNLNPAKRMFKKSYLQIIGRGEEQYEKTKKKFFNKFYAFSHDHHGHYLLSYQIFKDHPVIGTGPKGFRYLCRNKIYILENNDGCSTHPHNTYMQILTSNGIVGFSLITFSFFFFLFEIFKYRKKLNQKKEFDKYLISQNIALAAIFVNLWPLIPTGNFFNNWLSMIYFYPISFYLYLKFRNEKKIS